MSTLLQRLVAALEDDELRDIRALVTEEMKQRPLRTVWLTEVPDSINAHADLLRFFQLDGGLSEHGALRRCIDVRSGKSVNMQKLTLDAFDRLSRIPGVVLKME